MLYIPEWERPDCPTKGMTQTEMVAYYKRTAPLGDARFYAAVWQSTPEWAERVRELAERMRPFADSGKPIPRPLVRELVQIKRERAEAVGMPEQWRVNPGPPMAVDIRVQREPEPGKDEERIQQSAANTVKEILERREDLLHRLAALEDLLPEYVVKAATFGRRVKEAWAAAGRCAGCGAVPGEGGCPLCREVQARDYAERKARGELTPWEIRQEEWKAAQEREEAEEAA